jgi:hypothetical protein
MSSTHRTTVNRKLGGKSGRPSSPPHPALGGGGVTVDEAQRASDLPAISHCNVAIGVEEVI